MSINEAEYSRQQRQQLALRGLPSIKTNDRVRSGIPDIYCPPNIWIESKIVPNRDQKVKAPLAFFTPLQRDHLDTFTKRGCACFASVLFIESRRVYKTFLFMPWWYFRRIRIWNRGTLEYFGEQLSDGENHGDFTWWFTNGNWNAAGWDQKWREWPDKDKFDVFDPYWAPKTYLEEELDDGPDAEDHQRVRHPVVHRTKYGE